MLSRDEYQEYMNAQREAKRIADEEAAIYAKEQAKPETPKEEVQEYISPETQAFRNLVLPILEKYNLSDKENISFLDDTKVVTEEDIVMFKEYFEQRFFLLNKKRLEKHYEEKDLIENHAPPTFIQHAISNKFIPEFTWSLIAVLIIHFGVILVENPTFTQISFILCFAYLASIIIRKFFSFNNFIAARNKKQTVLSEEDKKIQEEKFFALSKIVETRYIQELPIEERLQIGNIDAKYKHMRDKKFNIGRYIFESCKSDNIYWNKTCLEKIFAKFHHSDEMRIEDFIASQYKDYDISKTKIIEDFKNNLLSKRDNFDDNLKDMDEDTLSKYFSGNTVTKTHEQGKETIFPTIDIDKPLTPDEIALAKSFIDNNLGTDSFIAEKNVINN